jgi:hypothetical protein
MELKLGKLIYLNHYSGKRPIVSSIVQTEDEYIRVLLTEKLRRIRLLKYDPIVVSYFEQKKIIMCEGFVKEVNESENLIKLRIDNTQEFDNKRLFERFPVSLYSLVTLRNNKKITGVIKNISVNGMSLSSKADLRCQKTYQLELYINDHVLNVEAEITWKNKDGIKFQYGIKTKYPDYIVKNTVKLFLSILKDEQEMALKNELLKLKTLHCK